MADSWQRSGPASNDSDVAILGNHSSGNWSLANSGLGNMTWSMDDVLKDFKESLYTYRNPRTIALLSFYGPVFMLALGGNILVITVIFFNKGMRSVTNYFLLNLAVADLLVTLVCIPLTVGEIIYQEWIYGLFLCKTTSYLQGVSIAASVLTITALSLDRYIAIRHPVKSRHISTISHAKKVLCLVWIIACCIMVPLIVVRHLTVNPIDPMISNDVLTYCHELWPGIHDRPIYDVFLFVFIYVFPGTLVIFSYSTTGCHLLTGTMALQRQDSDIHQSYKVVSSRRRVARMLLLLAVLFAASWLPYYIITLYASFSHVDRNNQDTLAALSFALLLGHSHSAQNPILYCIMNASFKRGMLAIMKCRRMNPSELSRTDTLRGRTDKGGGKMALRPCQRPPRGYGGVAHSNGECNVKRNVSGASWGQTRMNNSEITKEKLLAEDDMSALSEDICTNSQRNSRQERGENMIEKVTLTAIYEPKGQRISVVKASSIEEEAKLVDEYNEV